MAIVTDGHAGTNEYGARVTLRSPGCGPAHQHGVPQAAMHSGSFMTVTKSDPIVDGSITTPH